MRRHFPIALTGVLAVVTGLSVAHGDEGTLPQVRTAPVEFRSPLRELRFAGTTRARQRARLAFPVGGRLIEQIEAGRAVRRGQILARLDPREFETAVLEADAALRAAEVAWRRSRRDRELVERLVAVGVRTAHELEEARSAEEAARARVHAARSRLERAEYRLDESALRAPFAGTVSRVLREAGEHAAAGQGVVVVSGEDGVEVTFDVPEALLRSLRLRTPVAVDFSRSGAGRVPGRIASLTYGAQQHGLFPAVVALEGAADVVPGASADVIVEVAEAASKVVPLAAIVDPTGSNPAVFRLVEGRAQRVRVRVVGLVGEHAMVSGDLSTGDRVVVSGHLALLEGDAVEALPAAPAGAP